MTHNQTLPRAPYGLKTEPDCGNASSPRREEGEYSTYLTDEQRRDATQIRDLATDSNRLVLWANRSGQRTTRIWQ